MKFDSILSQGSDPSKIFGGKGQSEASRLLYSDTPSYFAQIISKRLKPGNYNLVDLGSFRGELLCNTLKFLKGYSFYKIGLDINESALKENSFVDKRVVTDLAKTPLETNLADLTLGRYILVWNPWKKQKSIIDELVRITGGFAIIQHAGADNDSPESWRNSFKKLFDGKKVSKLKRTNYFFSSRNEIETYFKEKNISFERLNERRVDNMLDTLIERFQLNTSESDLAKKILGKNNYIIQTTWIIDKKSN